MNTEQKDKLISFVLLLISVSLVIYGIGLAGFENPLTRNSFFQSLLNYSFTHFFFLVL